jgi:hypothetical protein
LDSGDFTKEKPQLVDVIYKSIKVAPVAAVYRLLAHTSGNKLKRDSHYLAGLLLALI